MVNINDKTLDELVHKIFEIIPSYYDEKESFEIKQLIIEYSNENLLENIKNGS